MEITFAIANGDFTKFDEILNWDIDRYLFQGEYILKKKYVENLK